MPDETKLLEEPKEETDPIVIEDEMTQLAAAFDGDYDIFLFYVSWLKNGLDATRAYEELHPRVKHESAMVLGSKALSKINKKAITEAYGLDVKTYFDQLSAGLKAGNSESRVKGYDDKGKPIYEFIMVPDHLVRKPYHDKLGKLLNLETSGPTTLVQQNNVNVTDDQLDRIIS